MRGKVAFLFHHFLSSPPYWTLRLVILNNACPPRLTAAAGTRLARTYSSIGSLSELRKENFTQRDWIRLSPIVQDSPLLPRKIPEYGPCFSSVVAGHLLRSAKDRRLGGLLYYQLPNPTGAHLKTI